MKTPTRHAPHIWDHVLAKIALIWLMLTRSRITVMIQDTRMAEPPTNGVQLNTALMVAPGVIAELAVTTKCSSTIAGRCDHGPVQATTTAIRIPIGSQAMPTSPAE